MVNNSNPELVTHHSSLITAFTSLVIAFISAFIKDIRFGLRMMIKNPGFSIVAVLILALGIGINTSIFSMINAVLLRSLPVPNPHELRVINWIGDKSEAVINYNGMNSDNTSGLPVHSSFPYSVYCSFRDKSTFFSDVFAFCSLADVSLADQSGVFSVDGSMVSGNFFTGFGVQTAFGRILTPADDQIEAEPAAVITYRYWQNHFSPDTSILGQTIRLNKKSFTIVGVLKPDFVGPSSGDPADFYISLAMQPYFLPSFSMNSPKDWWVELIGRLAHGANTAQSQSSLDILFRQWIDAQNITIQHPSIQLEDGSRGVLMSRTQIVKTLWVLQATVGLILLITCINIASLLLVRDSSRQREMAIRTAIGANLWRLIRQSLTENLLLSFAGAALGIIISEWCKATFLTFLSFNNDYNSNLHFDNRTDLNVLAFTAGIAILTTLLFGLLPAIRAAKLGLISGLKDRTMHSTPNLRLGKILVSLQAGLSIILVMGAGLIIQSFVNLSHVDPGFHSENLLLFEVNAEKSGYKDQNRNDFFNQIQQSITAIPGVNAVACSQRALGGGNRWSRDFSIPGHPVHPSVWMMFVSDSFFETMGINLLHGRDFNEMDTAAGQKVAIVNEMFAKELFQNKNPLGESFVSGQTEYSIVGVCKNTIYANPRDKIPPTVYFSYRQESSEEMCFAVRSNLPSQSLVPSIRKTIAAIDSTIPVTNIRTQQQHLQQSIAQEHLFAMLGGFLALLAMLLSCIGLYGLMAFTVKQRTNDIGIRMALGAQPRDVMLPVIREAFFLSSAGVIAGIPITLGLAYFIRSVLYGIQPYDPATLIGSSLILIGVATLSAWVPARRAARIDPMTALRSE